MMHTSLIIAALMTATASGIVPAAADEPTPTGQPAEQVMGLLEPAVPGDLAVIPGVPVDAAVADSPVAPPAAAAPAAVVSAAPTPASSAQAAWQVSAAPATGPDTGSVATPATWSPEAQATPSATPSAAAGVAIPDFATRAWIVADADSGDILAGQSIDQQLPMASTLKALTALTLLPRLQLQSVYQPSAVAATTEGAHVGVLAGNRYTVEQLMQGMLMQSGNDAAIALAEAYGTDETLAAMNAEAGRIGAVDTVAKNPDGLDMPGQVTTAADLAQIFRAARRDSRFETLLTTRAADFPGRPPVDPTLGRGSYEIFNHDSLLLHNYPGFLGGKTGFTSQAGRTYVAAFDKGGRTLVVALLGIGGGTTSTAKRIVEWADRNVDSLAPIGSLPDLPEPTEVTAVPARAGTADVAPIVNAPAALAAGRMGALSEAPAAGGSPVVQEGGTGDPSLWESFISVALRTVLLFLAALIGTAAVLRARVVRRRRSQAAVGVSPSAGGSPGPDAKPRRQPSRTG